MNGELTPEYKLRVSREITIQLLAENVDLRKRIEDLKKRIEELEFRVPEPK